MPVSFQIVVPRYCEAMIFRIAAAYERTHPIALPPVEAFV